MDTREIGKRLREIRRGENVLENVQKISLHISDLRYHAEYGKRLEAGVKKILHKDANEIEKELFFSVEAFIKLEQNRE